MPDRRYRIPDAGYPSSSGATDTTGAAVCAGLIRAADALSPCHFLAALKALVTALDYQR
jgi:hypothetical protein